MEMLPLEVRPLLINLPCDGYFMRQFLSHLTTLFSLKQPHQSVSGGPPASNFRKDSYILHLQRKWAEPNGVHVVLILPDDTTAALRANCQA